MKLQALKYALRLVTFIIAVAVLSQDCTAGIERTAKRWYMLDLYGGTSMPQGENWGIVGEPLFTDYTFSVPADSIYKDAFHLGLRYAALSSNWLMGVGFRYTNVIVRDTIDVYPYNPVLFRNSIANVSQWDLDLFIHCYPLDLTKNAFSPYLGIDIQSGILSLTASGYKSRNEMTFAISADFGADIKIFSGESGRSFVTLASVNSYQFVGTNDRPKYLNVGVGLKYFFRP